MLFNSPISSEKADWLVQLMQLQSGSRALDVGCGTGEFLLRIVAHHGVSGVGIDHDPQCIAVAQASATARGLSSPCEFLTANVREYKAEPGTFDLGICIGATHAFGEGDAAYSNTIEQLKHLVRSGGYALIGESYWKQEPPSEYLKFLGEPTGIYRSHAENILLAEERGLIPLYAVISNEEEWDDFEWQHHMRIRNEVEVNPDDPMLAAKLNRAILWRNGYLRWGRSTMGFGLYLFRVP